jgi:hypothetical protein
MTTTTAVPSYTLPEQAKNMHLQTQQRKKKMEVPTSFAGGTQPRTQHLDIKENENLNSDSW